MALVVLMAGAGRLASAQAPTPPTPAPTIPAPAADSPAQLAERLRKMEEMNQKLLQQFDALSKQNQELNDTVNGLSKRLQDAKPSGAGTPRAASNTSTGGTNISSGVETTGTALSGGLNSPSTPGGSSNKAGKDQVPLKAFADLSYRQRYGYVFQSENEEYELRVNGLVQFDSRVYQQHNQSPVINDFDIPRARMYFSGRLTKPIEYMISFQRSTNNLDILNAYFNFHYDDRLQLRIGRYRAPYTYEWAKLSIWELPTLERSPFAANFGPNRQVGFMAWGNTFQNRLEYAVGMFGGARNSFQDFNSPKDLMAFVDYRPFLLEKKSPLQFLSVGGSVDTGQENNPLAPALLRGSTTASTNTLTSGSGDTLIAVPFLQFNNNVKERGNRTLWEVHATYFYKQLALLAAYDFGNNDFALTTAGSHPVFLPVSGYFVQASYMLTGERREKITLVQPLHPFDLRAGKFGLGAIELQARVSELSLGDQVFSSGLADRNLWANRADFVDAGVNWYLNRNIKFLFDWEHAVFNNPVLIGPGQGLQKTSDLFWLRAQIYF